MASEMNKEQKAVLVEELAAQIKAAEAVLAVDYRGISVRQAAQLRERLGEAGATFRIVKNTLTRRAADQADAAGLAEVLEGPTAFTFVWPDGGDVALAAKALATFRRQRAGLEFKGGRMDGEPLSAEQMESLSRLPARDLMQAQLVGAMASPVTGLVRGLNQLIAGLALQLGQMADDGLVGGGAGTPAEVAAPSGRPEPGEEPKANGGPEGAETEPEAGGEED
jgi:large subunit ribosomal protein L10